MARKKRQEEHENHERWLVSYADFITLLFAFFVVMYSVSSVNEGKYRVLSDSIVAAFDPSREGLPIQLSSPLKPPIIDRRMLSQGQDLNKIKSHYPEVSGAPQASEEDKKNLRAITKEIEKKMSPLIDKDLVNLKKNDLWVEIEIKSSILYGSGSAHLSAPAQPVLRQVAKVLKAFPNQIQVEGFTDNVPIDTEAFPSNWELSAARAASVVHLFEMEGINPKRMTATGYGEYKPIASNDTAKGRRKNRRVNIVILSDAIARTTNRTEQLQNSLAAKRQAEKQSKPAVEDKPVQRVVPITSPFGQGTQP
jgi:chemotaxis protein MotB